MSSFQDKLLLFKYIYNQCMLTPGFKDMQWLGSGFSPVCCFISRDENRKQAKTLKLLSLDQNASSLNPQFSLHPNIIRAFFLLKFRLISRPVFKHKKHEKSHP